MPVLAEQWTTNSLRPKLEVRCGKGGSYQYAVFKQLQLAREKAR